MEKNCFLQNRNNLSPIAEKMPPGLESRMAENLSDERGLKYGKHKKRRISDVKRAKN